MRSTHFHEAYHDLVKGRAYSYIPQPQGGYRYVALSFSTTGATSLFTTVEDLARWDGNFYDGRVGGLPLLEQMQIKGRLNSGKEIDYASGLIIGEYRGLKTVEHGGSDARYRTYLLRFPQQRFSVIVLGNVLVLDPWSLVITVAGEPSR